MAAHLAGSTRPAVCLFELFGRLVPSLLLLVIHRQKKVENKCVLWITEWTGSFLLVSGLCFIKTGCLFKIGAIRLPLKETIKQYFTFLLCHSCRESCLSSSACAQSIFRKIFVSFLVCVISLSASRPVDIVHQFAVAWDKAETGEPDSVSVWVTILEDKHTRD